MDKCAKLLDLSWGERWVLVRALVFLPITCLTLRLFGLRRVQSTLARRAPINLNRSESDTFDTLAQARATARVVIAAARYGPYRAKCLPTSLTIWSFLRQQGVDSQVRIGVRRTGERVDAHAWVEYAGTVLSDAEDVHARFAAFDPDIAMRLAEA